MVIVHAARQSRRAHGSHYRSAFLALGRGPIDESCRAATLIHHGYARQRPSRASHAHAREPAIAGMEKYCGAIDPDIGLGTGVRVHHHGSNRL